MPGTRTPTLTRQNAVYLMVLSRLGPFQSRSLLAETDSGLDGVKSEIKPGVPGTPERRIGLTETAIALLSSIMNDEKSQLGDATRARDVSGRSGE
ncbi:MAG: hypothetical protein QOE94_2105 [Mycobacterium sp.]|nr:hypothetical protein [Mycobacterium sp.]